MGDTEKSLLIVHFCRPPLLEVDGLRLDPANRHSHRLLIWLTVRPQKNGVGFAYLDEPRERGATEQALEIGAGALRSARSDLRRQLEGLRTGLGDELLKPRLGHGEGDQLQLAGRRLYVDVVDYTERLARAQGELDQERWPEAAELATQIAAGLAGAFEGDLVKPWLRPFAPALSRLRTSVTEVELTALRAIVRAPGAHDDAERRAEVTQAGRRLVELGAHAQGATALLHGSRSVSELRSVWRDVLAMDLPASVRPRLRQEFDRLEERLGSEWMSPGRPEQGAAAEETDAPLAAEPEDTPADGASAPTPQDPPSSQPNGWWSTAGAHGKRQLVSIGVTVAAIACVVAAVIALGDGGGDSRAAVGEPQGPPHRRASGPRSAIGWWPARRGVVCPTRGCMSTTPNQLNARVFTVEQGVNYPTGIPDERAFVIGYPERYPDHFPAHDVLDVRPGDHVRAVAIVSNIPFNASALTRGESFLERSKARTVRASFLVPQGCGVARHVVGVVSHSGDGNDEQLSDSLTLRSQEPICVRAIPGSAELDNQYGTFQLPDTIASVYDPRQFDRRAIFNEGPLLGCAELDGELPGGSCDGYVRLGLEVQRHADAPLTPSRFTSDERLLDLADVEADGPLSAWLDLARDRRTARFSVHYAASRTEAVPTIELLVPSVPSRPVEVGALTAPFGRPRGIVSAALTEDVGALPVIEKLLDAPRGARWDGRRLTLPSLLRGRDAEATWLLRLEPVRLDVDVQLRGEDGDWADEVPIGSAEEAIEARASVRNASERGLADTSFQVTLPTALEFAAAPVLFDALGNESTLEVVEASPGGPRYAETRAEVLRAAEDVRIEFSVRLAGDPGRLRFDSIAVNAFARAGGVHGGDDYAQLTSAARDEEQP